MAYAINFYTANGVQTTYSVTFPYISQSDVEVKVDNVTKTLGVDYTFPTSSTINFTTAPANGLVIKFTRNSNRAARLVDYQDGSTITEAILDQDSNQMFYMAQEAIDITENTIALADDDKFDAQSKVIKNVATPVADTDAVNKQFISTNLPNITTVAGINADVTTVAGISANVTTVANDTTDIGTVASNISSVTTVATNINDVIAVANDLAEAVSEVETVANDLNEATSEIDTVATNITNVNTVGTNIANVNTVAGIDANVTTVAGISADVTSVAGISTAVTNVNSNSTNINAVNTNSANINTVAGNNTNIATVAGVSSDVTSVAGNNANVSTVAGISSDVTSVATNNANITSVAGSISNVNTVGGSIANVNAVGTDIANVNTVATNLASVNNFGEVYRISATAPTTSLDDGDMWFDTTTDKLKIWNGSSFDLAGSSVNGTSARFTYNITGTPSSVTGADANGSTLAYDAGFADVYVNGVRMSSADITITSGTSVVFASALADGDVVDVVAYGTFNVAAIDASSITSGTLNIDRVADGSITNAKLATPFVLTNPTISGVTPSAVTNSATDIVITGTNFVITPTVEFHSTTGAVYYPNTVTRNSATQLTVNATLAVDGTYFVRVENPDGLAGRSSTALLTVSDAPTWSTASGSIGSLAAGGTASFAIAATSDSAVTYSIASGALPGGLSLNTSTGAITGTESGTTAETTYNFTARAADAELQTADRAFTITVTVGINNGIQFN